MSNTLIDDLLLQKQGLRKKIEDIDKALNALGYVSDGMRIITTYSELNNPKNLSWTDKTIDALKHFNRFVHSREIAEYIHENFEPTSDIKDVKAKASIAISNLKNSGAIIKYELEGELKSNLNVFWGIPKYLDENGNILSKHKYDESQVSTSKKASKLDW